LRNYIIVGSGAAGLTAAETIRKNDPQGSLQIITSDPFGFYSRPGLAYYLANELPEDGLYPYREGDYHRLGLNFVKEKAARINPAEHTLHLSGGRTLHYDRLLIATGATASPPDVPGADLEGVVKLDNMEDTRRIIKLTRRATSAVVVGGGITALEIVEGLAARGVRTHYFLRGDRYWSSVLDETESKIVEERLKEDGVILHYHTRVAEILKDRNRLAGVRTEDGDVVASQLLAFAIGIRPNKELAAACGLAVKRGIQVDDHQQTSDPDIFAAGDVAQVIDAEHPEGLLESLWNPAHQQGQVAGANMSGETMALHRSTAINVTRLAGLVTTIIGQVGEGSEKAARDRDLNAIMRGDSEEWRQLPNAVVAQTHGGSDRLRLYIGENAILGALVMGDQALSRPLQNLIERRVGIRELRPRLLQPNAPLSELIQSLWQATPARPARNLPLKFKPYAA
jgi:nitrite reductase (NADH) large subunit